MQYENAETLKPHIIRTQTSTDACYSLHLGHGLDPAVCCHYVWLSPSHAGAVPGFLQSGMRWTLAVTLHRTPKFHTVIDCLLETDALSLIVNNHHFLLLSALLNLWVNNTSSADVRLDSQGRLFGQHCHPVPQCIRWQAGLTEDGSLPDSVTSASACRAVQTLAAPSRQVSALPGAPLSLPA